MNQLYPHQEAVIPEVLRSLRPDNPTVLVSPTGAGKTVIAAEIALHFKRVLFVAHRIEITTQARAELGAHVEVMSIHAALHYGPESTDLLIIDEAHRATAATYRAIIKKYRGCAVLGLTATPRRTDGQGLIDVFEEIVECSSVKTLVETGYLVPYRALEAPDEALKALAIMKRARGDYEQAQLSVLMSQPRLIGDVVREYIKHGKGRRAVAFAVSVAHSKALEAAFLAAGIRAKHLDGKANEENRKKALRDLSDHKIDVLCNVNLFTEGWDCPAVSCVIMARPTCSITLYLQSVGRGMRTCDGKSDLLILDHAGNIEKHGYPDDPRIWSLESDEQRERREKEVAELERLHALGFDSIEAELEEKRRQREAKYTADEVARILQMHPEAVSSTMKRYNVSRLPGSGRARYLKSQVDEIAQHRAATYSCEEVRGILNHPLRHLGEYLSKRGVSPVSHGRYLKTDIDQFKKNTRDIYPAREVAKKLGIRVNSVVRALKIRGISPIPSLGPAGKGYWYAASEIDPLIGVFSQSAGLEKYSQHEVDVMLRDLGIRHSYAFLHNRGLRLNKSIGLGWYVKHEVDAAIAEWRRTQCTNK